MRTLLTTALALLLIAPAATAQDYPKRLPTTNGEVIIPSERAQWAYDNIKFAPARRVGDTIYVSGVIAGKAPNIDNDVEAYKAGLRMAFRNIEATLKASGASMADVVMINSFHVWNSPYFKGTRDEHIGAVIAVKDEFMPGPHPAWTAVGTSGLLSDTGLVEIQVIAVIPKR